MGAMQTIAAVPAGLRLADLSVPPPPPGPADWNDAGVVTVPGLFGTAEIRGYLSEWRAANGPLDVVFDGDGRARFATAPRSPGGWADCTPYMRHPGLARLVCDPTLGEALEVLIGEPAGVHLNLTGLVSTRRDWHQDSYLNPPGVGDAYAAVWIALGHVHPDAGPFQYVPGSHRWPQVTREIIGRHVDLSDPRWPTRSEAVLSPVFDAEITACGAEVVTHLPRRGDALIWHGRLCHRGTVPNDPGLYRPGVIAHYSGIHHRPDMPAARRHEAGGWYFPIANSGPVR